MSICVCKSCEANCVPSSVKQGESGEWAWTLCDYPASEYSLQFRFRGPGTGFDVNATADGDSFDVAHVFGASLTVGKWAWQAWVTETATPTNTFVVKSGTIAVETGFAASGTDTFETRSPAQQTLDAIDAAMLAFATSDITEYELETPAGRRRVKRSDKVSLLSMRKYYASIVAAEKRRDRLRNGGSLMKSIPIVMRER